MDWTNSTFDTIYPVGNEKVPKSCCTKLDEGIQENDCLTKPESLEDNSRLRGCYSIFKESYENNEQNILIVLSIVVAIMVFNLVMLFAFALCINPYERT